jgi:LysM repeat protein
VQAGDSLASIGARFDVPWEAIAAVNKISSETVLAIGQELIIPAADAPIPPTVTPRPRPTATPTAPAATPLPTWAAPVLESPSDQTPYSGGNAFIELKWQPVGALPQGAQYQVMVRYLRNGVTLDTPFYTRSTSMQLAPWLWGMADQPARRYTWFVTAVQLTTDGKGNEQAIPLSPPSASRTLTWN